ncbi:hypothetical protein [Providencia rettgeri]|uniref:hypothetical protein n=1 Tax=Providencia rettgeri TaxID=587 RepID=UPI0023AB134C|nr:hypothetical protein [Providencia rettgeri]
MKELSLLDKRRKHFIDAFFGYLKRKNKKPSFVRNIDGISYQVDLDAEVLKQSLINLYEKSVCRNQVGMNDKQIIDVYDSLYSKHGSLSNDGKDFISLITGLIAKHLHKKEIDNGLFHINK